MKISCDLRGDCLVIRLKGELDMNGSRMFKDKVLPLQYDNDIKIMLFNLTHVNFIDSTGLGTVLGRYRELKKNNGRVVLVGLKPQIKRVFSLAGILQIMEEYETEEEAMYYLAQEGVYNLV
ncbi:MAG: STAS domain-containing protein [Halanaerobiales bacterium]